MNKKNNKGCFSGVIGTIFVVLGVGAYAVISSLFNRAFVGEAFGNEIACGLMTKWLTGVGIAFILYEAIFILWEFDLLKKTKSNFDEKKGKRILLAVALICICHFCKHLYRMPRGFDLKGLLCADQGIPLGYEMRRVALFIILRSERIPHLQYHDEGRRGGRASRQRDFGIGKL